MSFEAYKVAVRLSLIDGVSSGLVGIVGQFHNFNKRLDESNRKVSDLERSLARLGKMTLAGGAMAAVGGFGLSMLGGPIAAAKEYETAYARFKTLNLGAEVNNQADEFARGTKSFAVSSSGLMETLRESVGMFGDIGIAKKIAPMIAELNAANQGLFGGKVGSIDSRATQSIMRFIDMRGLTNNEADFRRGLDLAQKLVTGSGGAIKFGDLESFAKRGGTAFKAMSDDGLLYMATVMQEMGGASAGTGLMSAYQNLVAGRTTKKAMAALQDLGLAKLGYIDHGLVGGKPYRTLQISDMQDRDLLRENFPLWVMKNVIPALEKKGINDVGAQAAVVNDILSNRTGSSLGVNFATQFLQTLRDKKLTENAMGAQGTIDIYKNSPAGKMANLQANWKNLLLELGENILPIAIKGVEGLNSVIRAFIKFSREFPTLTKWLTIGFGVLSGIVAAGGVLMLATAGFRALGMVLAFTKVGGAVGLGLMAIKLGAVGVALYGLFKLAEWADNKRQENKPFIDAQAAHESVVSTGGQNRRDDPTRYQTGAGIAQRQKMQQAINNTIVMPNGEVLARVVTSAQSREMSRPSTGPSRFDSSMSPVPVGAGAMGGR